MGLDSIDETSMVNYWLNFWIFNLLNFLFPQKNFRLHKKPFCIGAKNRHFGVDLVKFFFEKKVKKTQFDGKKDCGN